MKWTQSLWVASYSLMPIRSLCCLRIVSHHVSASVAKSLLWLSSNLHLEVLLWMSTSLSPIVSTLSGSSSRFCSFSSSLNALHQSPSALLSLTQHVVITFMLMTLNYSFPSLLRIFCQCPIRLQAKIDLVSIGCLRISLHSIKLKLSFSSLVENRWTLFTHAF